MELSKTFISKCGLKEFAWCINDEDDFTHYSEQVAQYYKEKYSLAKVLKIFKTIDDYFYKKKIKVSPNDDAFKGMESFYLLFKKQFFEKFFKEYEADIDCGNPNSILAKYIKIFKPIIKNNLRHINAESILYRARLGSIQEFGSINGVNVCFNYPFYEEQIKNPPSSLANEGRFNRDGFSYYYLSSTESCAVAEVRPSVGDYCSIAKFKVKTNLNMFFLGYIEELKAYMLKPVVEGKQHYRYTQFFSDILFKCGLDGIQYNGVQDSLYCIVCFNPNNIEYVSYSEKLVKIDASEFRYLTIEPEFKKYKNWGNMVPLENKLSEEKKKEFSHVIAHEKDGTYLNNENSDMIDALDELNKLYD